MPRTSRPLQVFPIVLRRVEVTRVVEVTPNMLRLTLSGEELRAGVTESGWPRAPFRSHGFDDHVNLGIPPRDGAQPHMGTQEEHRFAWNPDVVGSTRDYTVRSWDPENDAFDIDVVRHDHGLAADWAARARPGDTLHVAGPKSCALVNHEADWHLLVGDETALPAIGRWLEEAPAGTRGQAIIEVPVAEDRQEIATAADVEIDWRVRGDVAAGQSRQLLDAVRALDLPPGRGYVWCAGEAMTIAPIRHHLRRDLGLPKEDVEVVGYWRLPGEAPAAGASTTDARTGSTITDPEPRSQAGQDSAERLMPAAPEPGSPLALLHEVHEMTELAPPVVTRVAVTLGIGVLVGSGVTTLEGLSRETAVASDRLGVLLDAMMALGLVESDADGRYANTALGGVLMEDSAVEDLSLDNPANRDALALVDLLDVLRSGRPTSSNGHQGWRARRATDRGLDEAHHDRSAEALQFVLDPLSRLEPVAGAAKLAVVGDAAATMAEHLGRGRAVQPPDDDTPWPAHDCAILVGALEGRTDAEAIELIRSALAAGPILVLIERTADQAAEDDHTAEAALTSLVLTGSPLRTSGDIDALLRGAGASSTDRTTLGWGFGPLGSATIAHA